MMPPINLSMILQVLTRLSALVKLALMVYARNINVVKTKKSGATMTLTWQLLRFISIITRSITVTIIRIKSYRILSCKTRWAIKKKSRKRINKKSHKIMYQRIQRMSQKIMLPKSHKTMPQRRISKTNKSPSGMNDCL